MYTCLSTLWCVCVSVCTVMSAESSCLGLCSLSVTHSVTHSVFSVSKFQILLNLIGCVYYVYAL